MAIETVEIKNGELTNGHVIVVRSDRGKILDQFVVQDSARVCTDPSNVHVQAKSRKTNGTVNWCMFDNAKSEVTL